MSTQANPVSDPYAAFGGRVAAPKQQQGSDPYAAFGGSVAKAEPTSAAPAAPASPADANSSPAFKAAVEHRMKAYGEPQAVAERHVRGELPQLVQHPPTEQAPLPHVTPKPGETFAQTMHRAVEMGKHVTPEEIERARQGAIERVPTVLGIAAGPLTADIAPEMEGAGLVPKLVNAGSRILTQGTLGAGLDVFGHLAGGEKPNLKSAAKTGAAFALGQAALGELPAAMLPVAKPAAAGAESEAARPGEAAAAETATRAVPESATVPAPATEPVPAVEPHPADARLAQNVEALKQTADPDRIHSPGDVDTMLDEAASQLQKNPEARTEPITFKQQQQLAGSLGMRSEDLLKSKADQPFKAEEMVAAKALADASLTETLNAARLADDPAYEAKFFENLARHQMILDQIKAKVGETARALGAARNAPATDLRQKALEFLTQMPSDARAELARRMAAIDPADTGALNRFVAEIEPSSTLDKVYEAWMNGLLSGGSTQILKTGSDLGMRLMAPAEKFVAATVDAVRSALTGSERTRFFGEAKADIYGATAGLPHAWERFAGTMLNEMDSNEFGARKLAIKGMAGRAVRMPTTILAAITDAFHALNYSAQLYATAFRTAAREGLSGDALDSRVAELVANPTDAMKAEAAATAQERTFQKPIGRGADFLKRWRSKPGGRWVLPFIKTPLNILKEGIRRSPLGLGVTAARAARGTLEGPALSDELSKNLLGSAIWTWALHKAMTGQITGNGPENFSQRAQLEQLGWQPYSVKIGNRYVSYHRFEPIGFVLGAAADFAEGWRENPNDASLADKFQSGLDSSADGAADLPFVYGFAQLARNWHEHGMVYAAEKYGRRFAGSFVPAAVAHAAWLNDPTIRSARNLGQQFESRIPGETGNVRPLTGRNGQPLVRPPSELGGVNPFPAVEIRPGLGEAQQNALGLAKYRRARQLEREAIRNGLPPVLGQPVGTQR